MRPSSRLIIWAERSGIAIAATAGTCLIAGACGRWVWELDLFANFRVQYALALITAALLLCLARRFAWSLAVLAAAVFAAAPIVPYLALPGQRAAPPDRFRFVTFNVYYGNSQTRQIAEYLQTLRADAIVVLELEPGQAQALFAALPEYAYIYTDGVIPYHSVVLSRWPMQSVTGVDLGSGDAMATQAIIDWQGQKIALLGVHLHWPIGAANARLRGEELATLASLARNQKLPLVVGGDFNTTVWSSVFDGTLRDSGLQDCAKGKGLVTSWPSFLPLLGIRIDHCLHSREWTSLAVTAGPALGSDHYPMINDLRLR